MNNAIGTFLEIMPLVDGFPNIGHPVGNPDVLAWVDSFGVTLSGEQFVVVAYVDHESHTYIPA